MTKNRTPGVVELRDIEFQSRKLPNGLVSITLPYEDGPAAHGSSLFDAFYDLKYWRGFPDSNIRFRTVLVKKAAKRMLNSFLGKFGVEVVYK